jgi:hypothetical protein
MLEWFNLWDSRSSLLTYRCLLDYSIEIDTSTSCLLLLLLLLLLLSLIYRLL